MTENTCVNDAIEGVNQQEMAMGRDHERNRGTVESDLYIAI